MYCVNPTNQRFFTWKYQSQVHPWARRAHTLKAPLQSDPASEVAPATISGVMPYHSNTASTYSESQSKSLLEAQSVVIRGMLNSSAWISLVKKIDFYSRFLNNLRPIFDKEFPNSIGTPLVPRWNLSQSNLLRPVPQSGNTRPWKNPKILHQTRNFDVDGIQDIMKEKLFLKYIYVYRTFAVLYTQSLSLNCPKCPRVILHPI